MKARFGPRAKPAPGAGPAGLHPRPAMHGHHGMLQGCITAVRPVPFERGKVKSLNS
jgi:hypothetical protein